MRPGEPDSSAVRAATLTTTSPPDQPAQTLIDEIENDPTGTFWG